MHKSYRLLCVLLFALNGCAGSEVTKVGKLDVAMPVDPLDRPFVFIEIKPAFSPNAVSGLLVAIWNDGRVLRSKSDAEIGKVYVRGRLAPEQIRQAREALGKSGILSGSRRNGMLVVDAMSEWVTVRWGDSAETWGHSPGFEDSNNAGAADARITRLHGELMALRLMDLSSEPLGEPWIPPQWRK